MELQQQMDAVSQERAYLLNFLWMTMRLQLLLFIPLLSMLYDNSGGLRVELIFKTPNYHSVLVLFYSNPSYRIPATVFRWYFIWVQILKGILLLLFQMIMVII